MLPIDQLPHLFTSWKARYLERDQRMERIAEVVRGEFRSTDPEGEAIDPRSPNLIQVAMEDTAEAASLMPTLRVVPCKLTKEGKRQAAVMEKIGVGYFELSQMELMIVPSIMHLSAYGFFPWVVWPDKSIKAPVIELRDPRTALPEPGHRPGSPIERCMFVREVEFTQLLPEHQQILADWANAEGANSSSWKESLKVTLVEYFDREEILLAALFDVNQYRLGISVGTNGWVPVELERTANKIGICPVVLGSRFTLDGEFRGQYDQVIGPLEAYQRLTSLMLDYADQAVYSDIFVKDLIGEMPWGGGGVIQLGPQGQVGRVPPATTSLDVHRDLSNLVDAIHLGGRWPKSRPGEVDQSIASAKFIEAAAGMMNTAIRTFHLLLKHAMQQALRICFLTDKKFFPGVKTTYGTLRNQQFLEEYDATKDINPDHRIQIEYGLGLGRDPAQAAVLMIQYAQNDYISHEFVMENIDGVTDVERERRRLDMQKFREMMLAQLLEGLQTKSIPPSALVDIMEAREDGKSLTEIFRKYVVVPQEEALDAGQQSGLTGELLQPGGIPGLQPPGLPALPPGAGPPPAPPGTDLMARLRTPAGSPGSFIASDARG